MLTLKLGTVCEKVIIDANGVASIIGLFSSLSINVVPGMELPANAVAPKEWAAYCLWECTEDEAGREFNQIFEVTSPSVAIGAQTINFTPQMGRLRQNVIANSQGVPVGVPGTIRVTTRVEHAGRTVVEPLEFSFEVVHVQPPNA